MEGAKAQGSKGSAKDDGSEIDVGGKEEKTGSSNESRTPLASGPPEEFSWRDRKHMKSVLMAIELDLNDAQKKVAAAFNKVSDVLGEEMARELLRPVEEAAAEEELAPFLKDKRPAVSSYAREFKAVLALSAKKQRLEESLKTPPSKQSATDMLTEVLEQQDALSCKETLSSKNELSISATHHFLSLVSIMLQWK